MSILKFLYRISTQVYFLAIKIAALFQPKAKLWVHGRKDIFQRLETTFRDNQYSIFWIHCASLGEFEQGRPLIELVKNKYPNWKILLTFFSPSGYEIRKNYQCADYVFYLPSDTPKNARKFLSIVQPKLSVFVKYEFWFYYLNELKKQKIPTFLISAIFRENQPFFKKEINGLHLKMLSCFAHIFVQNERSQKLLSSIHFDNVSVIGDTRVDRVISIRNEPKEFRVMEEFCGENPVFIAGSTWSKDEDVLLTFINQNKAKNWKWIIAPHDIQASHIQDITRKLQVVSLLYSNAKNVGEIHEYEVLIIDNIGMLSTLYRYADLAYIGGGFGSGIHNILEPAAFDLPIIFGPKYQKFNEANILTDKGGAFSISNRKELELIFNHLGIKKNHKKASSITREFINSNEGATLKILESLTRYLKERNNY